MRNFQRAIIAGYFVVTCLSCNQQVNEKSAMLTMADSTGINPSSSLAAVENNKDASRKFIRTADLKFKVKSVIKSTYDIEELTNRQEGFVTFTDLRSTVDNFYTTVISPDSSLETTHYTVTNTMTVRVPNIRLDTTLKELAKNMDYLDHRIIKADDVSLKILANTQAQIRSAETEKRIAKAIDIRGKKLNETLAAENSLENKQEQNDNAENVKSLIDRSDRIQHDQYTLVPKASNQQDRCFQ